MNPTELQAHQLMQRLADFFEAEGIAYWVVGSLASSVYGDPRFTNDVDMVANMTPNNADRFCQHFTAPEYYVSEAAVREAIQRRHQFNVLHPASGLKVDVILSRDNEFSRSEASRVRRIRSEGEFDAWFGSPEDVILSKLVYFQLSGGVSEKHLRDIAGMMRILGQKLDQAYVAEWADRLGISAEWRLIQSRVGDRSP